MELKDYLRVARRRWRWIGACTLIVVALASLYSFTATKQYQSNAEIFVSTSDSQNVADAYSGGLFAQDRVASYAKLATGQLVSQRVVADLHLSLTPQQLQKRIVATTSSTTVILSLSFTDPNPAFAQRVTQGVADELTRAIPQIETTAGQKNSPVKATIIDDATLPTAPVSPKPERNIALGLVLGLLLGFGIAVLRETLDSSVRGSADIARATAAPLIGSIGYDKDTVPHPLISDLDTHAPRTEALRVLRTNLQFVDVDRSHKVVVVTSSVPEEGKTTTCVNLAISLADAGQKVLLIEGDLRRPRVTEMIRLTASVGLTTALVGRIDLDDAIQPAHVDRLDVLPCGAVPPNPAELIGSQAMVELLREARSKYDIVLIDAPPLLPVTDAALLTSISDGSLLVVRHGKTTRDQVSHSVGRIAAVDGKVLGVVLNMVPKARGSYGYGSSYGYGYGYAPKTESASAAKSESAPAAKADARA